MESDLVPDSRPQAVAVFVPRPNIVRVTHRTRAQPTAAVRTQIAPLNTRAFAQLPWKIPSPYDLTPDCLGTPEPNRYKDILPTARTRVVLNGEEYVRFPPPPPHPLPSLACWLFGWCAIMAVLSRRAHYQQLSRLPPPRRAHCQQHLLTRRWVGGCAFGGVSPPLGHRFSVAASLPF